MNTSSKTANAANGSVFRGRMRQLLHAFADAGLPSATGLQLLVGPNGVLVWTEAPRLIGQNRTQALRSLFGEVDGTRRSPIAGCYPPPGARGTPVHAPLEAL